MKVIMQIRIALLIAIQAVLLMLVGGVAHAAEINPAPGTYSYGSTSELSPYANLSQGSNLAPTGQSQMLGYLAIAILLIAAARVAYYVIHKRRSASGKQASNQS